MLGSMIRKLGIFSLYGAGPGWAYKVFNCKKLVLQYIVWGSSLRHKYFRVTFSFRETRQFYICYTGKVEINFCENFREKRRIKYTFSSYLQLGERRQNKMNYFQLRIAELSLLELGKYFFFTKIAF